MLTDKIFLRTNFSCTSIFSQEDETLDPFISAWPALNVIYNVGLVLEPSANSHPSPACFLTQKNAHKKEELYRNKMQKAKLSQTHLCAVEPALSVPVSLSVLPSSTCCRGDPVWSTTSLLLTSTPRINTPPPPPPPHPGTAAAILVVITGSANVRLPSQDIGELRLAPPTGDSGFGVAVPRRGARRAWRSKLGWRFLGGLGGSGASVGCKMRDMVINTTVEIYRFRC